MNKMISIRNEVESSNIKALTRIPELDLMVVDFVNGTKYLYRNVELSTFNSLVDAESVGKAFNQIIKKGNYPYCKL